jgi:hypothetical protein
MLKCVSGIKEITNVINPMFMSEHEVDATAIGYVALNEIRRYPFVMYAL